MQYSGTQTAREMACINAIRLLSIDAIAKANSGHPGLPLGAAPMAHILWAHHLDHYSGEPQWPNRDRFVLSAGHGSMLLYGLLHLHGYAVSMDDLRAFRQKGSITPGHPEFGLTPGVEATTGPLGQGAANAVGMAIAERKMANLYNREGFEIVNHYTYALVSDGDLMEGVSAEAASLAGHLKLGKLIYLYDANDITLDGPTSLSFSTENIETRYQSYGWQVIVVKNGDDDLDGLNAAIAEAKKDTTRPSIIIVKTTIGYGSPLAGTSDVHGKPLKGSDLEDTKKALGFDGKESFTVSSEVRDYFSAHLREQKVKYDTWTRLFDGYRHAHPDLAAQWDQSLTGSIQGQNLLKDMPHPNDSEASRVSSGKALNFIADRIPWVIGGDADLSCSTNTSIKDGGSFEGQHGTGRNIHYGVREHAMAAIANGICYHGGLRPFVATFFCFSDYMKPSVRLAAINHLPVIYVWTHDSVGVGEDGPTHQPIEHLAALRAIPHINVIRPADGAETWEAWKIALETPRTPTALILSRQTLPPIDRSQGNPPDHLKKGAYVVSDRPNFRAILIATGSEVSLAMDAQKKLDEEGVPVRVVSMPCWEFFEAQPQEYRDKVLPRQSPIKIAIEAGVSLGWSKWVGDSGETICIDQYGLSAPGPQVFEELGLTPEKIASKVKDLLSR